MTAPLIGVTGPSGWYHLAWRCSRFALTRAGARFVRLTPGQETSHDLDAVIIGGGDDIDPALYADSRHHRRGSYDRARDAFERRIIEDALERERPLLGICRGAQLLNATLGGDLHQDVRAMREHTSNRRSVLPRKIVAVDISSRLYDILGTASIVVNSLHEQAVNQPGEGLRIVARDRDGIVQAIEHEGDVLRVGVQWHPEFLPYRLEQRRLFRALVDAARRH